jgi:protein phosphatase
VSQAVVASQHSTVHALKLNGETAFTHRRRLLVRSYGLTDVGRVRSANEDQFLIAALARAVQVQRPSGLAPRVQYGSDRAHLFAVADGMGGHAGGQHASSRTIDLLEQFALDTLSRTATSSNGDHEDLPAQFEQVLHEADAQLFAEAQERPELFGMGTTATVAYTDGDQLHLFHAGDSRAYLFRDGQLTQLTRDHSMAQEMVRRGFLQAHEVVGHPWRHIITNALGGTERGVDVETHRLQLQPGDRLMLCSDGLTDLLSDADLAALLNAEPEPRQACERLVAAANEKGGRDNITVLIAHFDAA